MFVKKHISITALIIGVALGLSACSNSNMGTKQTAGTLLGGIGGAAIGSQFGSGTGQLVGVAAGALLGAFIGNSVGESLDKSDQMYANQKAQKTLENGQSGQTQQWRNPDSGHSGTITPIKTYQSQNGQYCREFQQTVNIGGEVQKAYGTACRQPDGSWKIIDSQ